MTKTTNDLETNKNAVIFRYQYLSPYGPVYEGEKPTGVVVNFHGYGIRTSIFEKGFRVFKNSENLSKRFPTLRDAIRFVIDRINKKRTLFD